MQVVTTVGLDIAKSVFQIDATGQVVIRRQLKRRYVVHAQPLRNPGQLFYVWPLGRALPANRDLQRARRVGGGRVQPLRDPGLGLLRMAADADRQAALLYISAADGSVLSFAGLWDEWARH